MGLSIQNEAGLLHNVDIIYLSSLVKLKEGGSTALYCIPNGMHVVQLPFYKESLNPMDY